MQSNITSRFSMGSYKPAPGLPQCRKLINTNQTQQTHTYCNVEWNLKSGKYLQILSVPITFALPGFEPGPFGKLPDDANHCPVQYPTPTGTGQRAVWLLCGWEGNCRPGWKWWQPTTNSCVCSLPRNWYSSPVPAPVLILSIWLPSLFLHKRTIVGVTALMVIGMIGAFLFILIQLVLLVDFAHAWNERWLSNYEESQSRIWFTGITLLCVDYML